MRISYLYHTVYSSSDAYIVFSFYVSEANKKILFIFLFSKRETFAYYFLIKN